MAVLVAVGVSVYVVAVVLHRASVVALDIYAQHLPMMHYAADAVRHGGAGLLWNPFQGCGVPFLGYIVAGLLYPPYLLYLVLEENLALHVILAINMVIGAVGMRLLALEFGLGGAAALGAMIAFELGDPMVQLTSWSPTHSGPWPWVPWALFFCERLLRAPSRRAVAGLAAVLAVQVLPGFVLIAALTWQLIALRVVWEVLTRPRARPWGPVLAIAAAMMLAAMLAAVQLAPAAEVARESFRGAAVADDIIRSNHLPLTAILDAAAKRVPPLPFAVAPIVLAVIAPFGSATRRLAAFYLIVGLIYLVLGFETSPFFRLYVLLPPGAAVVHAPTRLFWMTGFSLSVLAGMGLQALVEPGRNAAAAWLSSLTVAGALLALWAVAPGGLSWSEGITGVLLLGALAAAALPKLRFAAACLGIAALAFNLAALPLRWWGRLLPSVDAYWTYQPPLAALSPPVAPDYRLFVMNDFLTSLPLMQKTSMLMHLPGFYDYDPLFTRRFAEYFNVMRSGQVPSGISEIYVPHPWLTSGFRRRLLDVGAVRYLLAGEVANQIEPVVDMPQISPSPPGLHIFRNDAALPRARWVPRVVVIPDSSALLDRLATGTDDLASVAFTEEPLPSGYTGEGVALPGRPAEIVTNDPEHIVIDVDAPERGFLVLADQYRPGWYASVNGVPARIHRANYLFRLIEVPPGRSRVDFRYRPPSVMLGGAISVLGGIVLVALVIGGRRSRG